MPGNEIVTVKIEGLDELMKVLKEKLPKEARLALRLALNEGGKIVQAAVEEEAPVEESGPDAGLLAKSIGVKTRMKQDYGYSIIGPERGVNYPSRPGKGAGRVTFKTRMGKVVSFMSKHAGIVSVAAVANWCEFGTSRGMKPDPFMTRAWESCKAAVQARIIENLKVRLHI